jgi:hypothetical protein
MGKISNIGVFNSERQELLKIKTFNEDTILFTKEEAKAALVSYIEEELDLFASGINQNRKKELQTRLDFKLNQLENLLVGLINERIDKITERIVSLTINRVIDEEVNKRVELKLKKLKDNL